MKAATASRPELDFVAPAGVVLARADPLSGALAGPNCATGAMGVFPKEMAASGSCSSPPAAPATGSAAPDQSGSPTDDDSDTAASPND